MRDVDVMWNNIKKIREMVDTHERLHTAVEEAKKPVKKPKAKPQTKAKPQPKIVQVKESPWVRIKVPMNDEQVVRYVGEPCEEFEPRCAACKAWAMWAVTGEIPVSVDREKFFAKLFFGELD